jgi:tape measure domain-containing protein
MTVSEKIVLREDVARPADRAASSVERLAGALGGLGQVHVDSGAAAKIERTARAASKAEERAKEAAGKAAALREKATAAEEKAQKASERAAKLRADGIEAGKADVIAQRAAATASRRKAAALRAEEGATKRQATAEKQRARASMTQRAAEHAAEKAAAKARKDAAREEARKKHGLSPKVSKGEARLHEAIQRFNPAQHRREALLERHLRDLRRKARAGIDEGGSAESGGGGLQALAGKGGSAAAAAALAAVAATVAAAAGRMALDFGEAAIDAAAFREDATRALETLLKSRRAADRALQSAITTADYIGQGRQETLGQFVSLIGKGFDPVLVDRIVRSIADLGTVNPEANVDAIVRAMGKIKAQGYLQGDELTMLTEAGLSAEKVYEQLARKLGKTSAEIRRMQGAGKLDAASTIEAILGAINEQAGGRAPGLAARAKSLEDITGLLGRLRALPGNLLMDLDVTPGMQNFKGFVGGVLESLDPAGPRWRRITAVLGKLLNTLFSGIFDGPDPGKIIDGILAKVEQAEPLISAAISGFKTGFGVVLRVFEKVGEMTGGGPFAKVMELLGLDDVPWIELVARGIGLIAGALGLVVALIGVASAIWIGFVGTVWGALLSAVGALEWFAESIWSLLSTDSMLSEGTSLGGAIVDGLVAGLKNGALAVANAAKVLAGDAVSSTRSALGIASPSRVFAGIGGDVASGAEVGIAGGAGRVIRAAEAMALGAARAANDNVLAPRAAGVVPGSAASPLGAGLRSGIASTRASAAGLVLQFGPGSVQITVQGGGTEADGAAVARGLWQEFRRIAEEAA